MNEPDNQEDAIDTAAADWTARLALGPLDAAGQRDLDRWLAENPRHGLAFVEARRTWDRLGALRRGPAPLGARRRWPAWAQAGALAASVLILAGGGRFWLGDPLILLQADDRTAPGEQKRVTLADGSSVDLGPASAIALQYGPGERRVELLSGEAYFTVAPMTGPEHRPFVVAAANGTARALGTQFMVDRVPDAVDVTVAEHQVEVNLAGPGETRAERVLSPGQSVRYAGSGFGPVHGVDLDQATAWQHGRLIFDHQPLGDVVAELNRYRRGRIVIADAALAGRTVSGVFETRDPDAALATICRVLGARRVSLPPLVTLIY